MPHPIPHSSSEYDEMMLNNIESYIEKREGRPMSHREVFDYIRENSQKLGTERFWHQMDMLLPKGYRDTQTYYLYFYSRRFFAPITEEVKYQIALHASKFNMSKNLPEMQEYLQNNYKDYHFYVTREVIENILTLLKRGKKMQDVLELMKERAAVGGVKLNDCEKYTNFVQTAKSTRATGDGGDRRRSDDEINRESVSYAARDASSTAADSATPPELRNSAVVPEQSIPESLNPDTHFQELQQYEQQLSLCVSGAIAAEYGHMSPLKLCLLYEEKPEAFRGIWPKIRFACAHVTESHEEYFARAVAPTLSGAILPDVVQHISEFADFFRGKDSMEKRALAEKIATGDVVNRRATRAEILQFFASDDGCCRVGVGAAGEGSEGESPMHNSVREPTPEVRTAPMVARTTENAWKTLADEEKSIIQQIQAELAQGSQRGVTEEPLEKTDVCDLKDEVFVLTTRNVLEFEAVLAVARRLRGQK